MSSLLVVFCVVAGTKEYILLLIFLVKPNKNRLSPLEIQIFFDRQNVL